MRVTFTEYWIPTSSYTYKITQEKGGTHMTKDEWVISIFRVPNGEFDWELVKRTIGTCENEEEAISILKQNLDIKSL